MITEEHYEEETLIALLDGEEDGRAVADPHLKACSSCRDSLDAYRGMISALGAEDVWNAKPLDDAPVASTIANLRAFADRMAAEKCDAAVLIAALLAGDRSEWMPRLQSDARFHTAGVARKLIDGVCDAADRAPADALVMADLAVAIATELGDAHLVGDARHMRAYTLMILGHPHDALGEVDRAQAAFERLASSEYELARLSLTRSMSLAAMDKLDDAVNELRAPHVAFEHFGDDRRLLSLLHGAAVIHWKARNFRAALEAFLSVERRAPEDDPERVAHLNNIAGCYREVGEFSQALEWNRRAYEVAQAAGSSAALLKIRWDRGRLLLAQQNWDDAIKILRAVIVGFDEAEMRDEVVYATLDLAEALLVLGQHEEVASLCSNAIAELRRANLEHTARSLQALTYLQEAVAARRATPPLVSHVRDFVENSRRQPALLFAPPPF